jgi:hypothetical protein
MSNHEHEEWMRRQIRRKAARRLHALRVIPWACAIDHYLATGKAVHMRKDGTKCTNQ